jgi:hypothetical protein
LAGPIAANAGVGVSDRKRKKKRKEKKEKEEKKDHHSFWQGETRQGLLCTSPGLHAMHRKYSERITTILRTEYWKSATDGT